MEIWSVRLFSEAALGPWSPPPHCVLPFSPFSQLLLSTSVKLQVATAHLCHQASYCDNSIFSLFIVFREVIQRIAGKKKKIPFYKDRNFPESWECCLHRQKPKLIFFLRKNIIAWKLILLRLAQHIKAYKNQHMHILMLWFSFYLVLNENFYDESIYLWLTFIYIFLVPIFLSFYTKRSQIFHISYFKRKLQR